MSSSRSSERARYATSFAVSSALPPPIETTASIRFSRHRATAASTTSAGGSATTSSNTVSSHPAARLASASWVSPAPRTPLSVTNSARRAPNSDTSPAIFFAAPASKRTLGVVWNVNGFIPGFLNIRRRSNAASIPRTLNRTLHQALATLWRARPRNWRSTQDNHLLLRHLAHGVGNTAHAVAGLAPPREGHPIGPKRREIVHHDGGGVEPLRRAKRDAEILREDAGLERDGRRICGRDGLIQIRVGVNAGYRPKRFLMGNARVSRWIE